MDNFWVSLMTLKMLGTAQSFVSASASRHVNYLDSISKECLTI